RTRPPGRSLAAHTRTGIPLRTPRRPARDARAGRAWGRTSSLLRILRGRNAGVVTARFQENHAFRPRQRAVAARATSGTAPRATERGIGCDDDDVAPSRGLLLGPSGRVRPGVRLGAGERTRAGAPGDPAGGRSLRRRRSLGARRGGGAGRAQHEAAASGGGTARRGPRTRPGGL